MCRSIDRYDTDPGGQARYHDGHHIAFSLWPKWIRTVECRILAIKKKFCGNLQIELYSVFLKVPIKQAHNSILIVIEEEHSFNSTYLELQHWKNKSNGFLSILYLELISILVNVIMYFWFLLFANICHDHELMRVKH